MRQNEKSSSRIEIRLTAEEKEMITMAAKDRGMSVSEFLRVAAMKMINKE